MTAGCADATLRRVPLVRQTPHLDRVRERGEAAFLDAAAALVDEGVTYSELSIATLAKRAGFSRPTFYAYFTDKRALASAVGRRFEASLGDGVDAWLLGQEDVTLTEALDRTVRTFRDQRGAVLLIAEAATYDAEIRVLWAAIHEHFGRLVRERLRRDVTDDPDVIAARASMLVWGTQATVVEHLRSAATSDDALVDALVVMWDAALGTPAG